MVEKIWYCPRCHYVPQNIPYDEQPRICPECNSPCNEGDFVKEEDFKAIMEESRREAKKAGFYSLNKKDD